MMQKRTRFMELVIVVLVLLAVANSSAKAQTPEFRAFWADVWSIGYRSISDIDDMVSRAVEGNYNAILPQVLAYHDDSGNSHGAYWNSGIVPKANDIVGDIDPLAELCSRAHAQGIEVHAWIIPYRVCLSWPPSGNLILSEPDNSKWIMTDLAHMDQGPSKIDGIYTLDPGSPDAQEYIVSIVRELVTDYDIDGIHFDRIRYSQTDAGYPSDASYTRSGLARYYQITGETITPGINYGPWNDFRRREVTELVRRVRAEIPYIRTNGQQPLRFSAALVTWGDAPSNFPSTSAYQLFQNWEEWMELGFLDTAIPMTYYDQDTYPTWYRNWVDKEMIWAHDRHMVVGQALYRNDFADSITQMQYARTKGADGICSFSYYETVDGGNSWSWYSFVRNNFYTAPVSTPTMPWRDPAVATEGTLWGRVTDTTSGDAVDDATVEVGSLDAVQTDGNGYYVVTLIPDLVGGTDYAISVTKSGLPSASHPAAIIFAGDLVGYDFELGTGPPTIEVIPTSIDRTVIFGNNLPDDSFTVRNVGDGVLNYTISDNADFLSVSSRQGTSSGELDTIDIYYETSKLAYGYHNAIITVEDAAATNTPEIITVAILVDYDGIPGDLDDDGDVDQEDFGIVQSCLTGPAVGPPAPGCEGANLDGDLDVDQDDIAKFQQCISGPNVSGNPNCAF
ncbi:MAG: family 10 glycosylhydrolase [Planctomycetota bacterium]|jgi:uncharacterized lipoprotein YddW (UPF0748 family)